MRTWKTTDAALAVNPPLRAIRKTMRDTRRAQRVIEREVLPIGRHSPGALARERPTFRRQKWYEGYASKYGLTERQIDKLLRDTRGRCIICEQRFRGPREPVLDHDHATGKPRGFLCNDCNRGLGDFKDRPKVLVRAARYLTGARL